MLTKDSFSHFVRSRLFAGIVIGIGIMIVLLCVFQAGVTLGYHEATFSSHWGENYEKNFGNGGMQGSMGIPDGHDPEPHGTTGQVISISGSTLVVQNAAHQEQKVVIGTNTIIRNQENTTTVASLGTGDFVVVVGNPDSQGNIDANLIRIMSSTPPTSSTSRQAATTTP